MNIKERLQVTRNLLDTKSKQVAQLDITRQTLVTEILELRGQLALLNEMLQEASSNSKEKDKKVVKK